MDNKAFEGNKNMKTDPEANYKMDEGKKSSWLSRNKTLLMLAMMLFVCCVFGVLYYIQQSETKEIRKELREAIAKLNHQNKDTQETAKSNPQQNGSNDVQYRSPAAAAYQNKEENKEATKHSMNKSTLSSAKQLLSSRKSLTVSKKPWLNMRLPTTIIPNTYDIELDIDMDKDTYKGNVTINVFVTQNTNTITLHMVGLHIIKVNIKNIETSREVIIKEESYYAPNEFYVIQTHTPLEKDEVYDISIDFTGTMGRDLNGFYTSFYNDGGIKKKVASTFFSPISARKAFPCFDEPSFKANFTLTLSHSSKYTAMSNMAPDSTCIKNNILSTKFLTTLKMSTYILCWVVAEYNYIKIENGNKVIQAWANDVDDVRFGLEKSNKLLSFYEEYFKIPYPLKKLDIVSIPSFGPGAMENWGIITFRAERILVKKTDPEELRQKSFNIIAHELVHQWFGNLVTMKFWNDAWLKEGFANNIGVIGGHNVDKSMGSKEQVLSSFMLPALELDSYATSHPISTNVKTPNDIRGIFDIITYNKGSCLVDLLHNYLGDEDFRKGLQRYLTTYAYQNANQDDLWEQLSKASGKNVKSVMDTWTLQLGYPVISVRRINESFVEIKQQRFSLDPPNTVPPKSPFGYLWKVPIIFMSPSKKETMAYLFEHKTAIINVPEHYSILNPDHSLFYRVNYDETMLASIGTMLMNKPNLLTAQDRTGIISDQFSFVSAKMTDIGSTLDLLSYLKHETDYYPWKVALGQLSYINSLLISKDIQTKFSRYILKLTTDIVQKISWQNTTTVNQGSLQVLLLNQVCQYGSDNSIVYVESERHYINWMLGKDIKLRPSLHPVFKDCAISVGPDLYWRYAYMKYKASGSDALLWSLASTTKMATIKQLLDYSLDNKEIDAQYTPYVISKLAERNHHARTLCWEFIKKHWNIIIERYGKDIFMLSDMLSAVLDGFSSEDVLKDIKTFFFNKDVGSGKNAVKQAIHKIEGNIEWKKNNFDRFTKWLEKQVL